MQCRSRHVTTRACTRDRSCLPKTKDRTAPGAEILGLKQPASSGVEFVSAATSFRSRLCPQKEPDLPAETSAALGDKQKSLLTLVRFSQRLLRGLTPQPLLELRGPVSSGVCNQKLPPLSIFGGWERISRRVEERRTRMSSGSRLCSLHADVMLLLRYDPERPMSSSSS